ncbi:MAG: hypothetical protein ACJZ4X_04195 [Candidatus Thalassarchaeaceae archaeon]
MNEMNRDKILASTAVLMMIFVTASQIVGSVELEEERSASRFTSSDTGSAIQYTASHTTVMVGPADRTAVLEMPGGHDYSRPLPLVVAMHGFGGYGQRIVDRMVLTDSVHENEHLLLKPDGLRHMQAFPQPRFWNATDACCIQGGSWGPTYTDDVSWLESIVDDAVLNYGADPEGIIFMGYSNGAFMSHRMACERGTMIKSIVALNGVTWNDFTKCLNTGSPDILHVHATDDDWVEYDGAPQISMAGNPIGPSPHPGANTTLSNWANRYGCDQNRVLQGTLDLSAMLSGYETDILDYPNCGSGERVTHWRINDGMHNDFFPFDGTDVWADVTLDWALQGFVRDSDGDGYRDDVDAFIYNPNEWLDADGDGVGSNTDECDNDPSSYVDEDGDGYCAPADLFPDDPTEWFDTDGDGVGDNGDLFPNDPTDWMDTDGDGVGDNTDAFPNWPGEWADTDGDGIGDNGDAFPEDPNETLDSDGDGVGNNGDAFPGDPNEAFDSDGDGIGDNSDLFPNDPNEWLDKDNDGVGNNGDVFPNDPNEWLDTDDDGVGDNTDAFPTDPSETADTDGDGIGDNTDAFPLDPEETSDFDGDGVGNNADAFPSDPSETADTDGDGAGDNFDAFPEDPNETLDSDGDGVGNNADAFPYLITESVDSDGDGVGDNSDAFPDDSSESVDSDGDGVGDNSDAFPRWEGETTDTDKDGVGDNTDVFPDDPFESADADGDGVGDNADFRPYDKDVQSESDLESFPIITLVAAGIVSIFALVIFQQKVLSKPSKSKKASKKSGGRKSGNGKRKLFSKDEINDRAAAVDWTKATLEDGESEDSIMAQLQSTGWSKAQSRAIIKISKK